MSDGHAFFIGSSILLGASAISAKPLGSMLCLILELLYLLASDKKEPKP